MCMGYVSMFVCGDECENSEIACQNKCKLLSEKENEDGFSINIFVKKLHFSLLKYLKFHPILLIVIEQNMMYRKYTCVNEKYSQLNFFH